MGEIDEIQIKFKSMRKPVVIDTRFKDYIEVLDGLEYPGDVQTISGNVMTAHVLPKKSVDIITSTRGQVKVWVSGQAFRSILRALDIRYPVNKFYICPMSADWFESHIPPAASL